MVNPFILIIAAFSACFGILVVIYVLFFIFFKEKYKIFRDNIYLIIPMLCIVVWALHFVIQGRFHDFIFDFAVVHEAGRVLLSNPEKIYGVYGYIYLPSCAIFHAFTYSLIPLEIAFILWYITNIILGILFVREFNKILRLKDLEDKWHRFLFLIIISNGYYILQHFAWNQKKFLAGVIIAFIIRRELQYRQLEKTKDSKFYLINYGLFIFVLGITLNFVPFFILYIFHDIPRKALFEKSNLKRYGIVVVMFLAQNFLLLIYPRMIREIYEASQWFTWGIAEFSHFYLADILRNYSSIKIVPLINFAFNVTLFILAIFLTAYKKSNLEVRFGYLSLATIVLYAHAWKVLLILLPFVLLLFIPFINKNVKSIEFIKQNKIPLIGMCSILAINLTPMDHLYKYPYFRGITVLYIFYLIILGCCLIILNIKKIPENEIYPKNIVQRRIIS